MHRAASLDPGDDALGVEPGPEPGHMLRLIGGADRVQGLIPGRQQLPRGRVHVVAGGLMPTGQLPAVEPHQSVEGHQTWW